MLNDMSDEKRMELLFYYLDKGSKLVSYEEAISPYMGREYEGTLLRVILPIIDNFLICDKDDVEDAIVMTIQTIAQILETIAHIHTNSNRISIQIRGGDVDILAERIWTQNTPRYYIHKNNKT